MPNINMAVGGVNAYLVPGQLLERIVGVAGLMVLDCVSYCGAVFDLFNGGCTHYYCPINIIAEHPLTTA